MHLSYEKIIFHLPTGILIIFKVMVLSDYSILHLSTGVKIKFMHVYIETAKFFLSFAYQKVHILIIEFKNDASCLNGYNIFLNVYSLHMNNAWK